METTMRNGVDVTKLTDMVEATKRDPKIAALRFNVHSEWKGGLSAQHTTSDYTVGVTTSRHQQTRTLTSDEPKEILGKDAGISPAEILLMSLSSCLMVGYAANAAAMGIELESLSIDLTGDGDLQGFMNIGSVRPGLSNIQVRATVRSKAPKEKLQELHDYVNAHSPIWDSLANPVRIGSKLIVANGA